MKQKYFFGFLLVLFLFVAPATFSQESPTPTGQEKEKAEIKTENPIEGLSIYPNPATGNRVYILTTKNLQKHIKVYNVLGKPVLSAVISGIDLNIASLESGIYIIKIREGDSTATRKLVIR
ncbi:MAG TPA: T9SS type A sorting domain-containing protein [Salinimicrobium sp.]|nr:T9SS type A sorting domain-containing protein [Salinimicrobium sp.]